MRGLCTDDDITVDEDVVDCPNGVKEAVSSGVRGDFCHREASLGLRLRGTYGDGAIGEHFEGGAVREESPERGDVRWRGVFRE